MVQLDLMFRALSDSTRRKILHELRQGEKRLSDLAQSFDMSQTAVSKHIRVLIESGFVNVEKRGRTRFCRLNARNIDAVSEWIECFRKPFILPESGER